MTFRPSVLPDRDNTILSSFNRAFNLTQRAVAIDQANKRADTASNLQREKFEQDLASRAFQTRLDIARDPELSFESQFDVNQLGQTTETTDPVTGEVTTTPGEVTPRTFPGQRIGREPSTGADIFFSEQAGDVERETTAIEESNLDFRLEERQRQQERREGEEAVSRRRAAVSRIEGISPVRIAQLIESDTATNTALAVEQQRIERSNVPTAETEEGLRREFNQSQIVKDSNNIAQNFARLQEVLDIPSSGPNDLSVIFSFMKMLDPGSVVREGEFANAENSQGVPDRLRAFYNRIRAGERLTDSSRAEFRRSANALVEGQRRSLAGVMNRFRTFATDQEVSPDNVVFDPFAAVVGGTAPGLEETSPPAAPGAGAGAAAPAPPVAPGALDAAGADTGDGLGAAERALQLRAQGLDDDAIIAQLTQEGLISN